MTPPDEVDLPLEDILAMWDEAEPATCNCPTTNCRNPAADTGRCRLCGNCRTADESDHGP